jgi:hypothetical protein
LIIDFLKTNRSKDDLRAALEVLREFKSCESEDEYSWVPFAAWAKLEQLEEFLAHLVDGDSLQDDTLEILRKNTASQ